MLIVEPHSDDAILSVGGTMLLRRQQCAFLIATMASRTNHTRYRELGVRHDIDAVTLLRKREADLAARMLGGEHLCVGMTDAALRYHDAEWTDEFYRRHQMSINASVSRTAEPAELERWTEALRVLVTRQQPAEVWFPLGGPHADHMLTADACFAAFTDPALLDGRILRIYQEVPYAVRYPHHMRTVLAALRDAGAVLEEESSSITQVRSEKRRLAAVYESQSMDELYAEGGDDPEVLWRIRGMPRNGSATGIVSQAISGQLPDAQLVAAWIERNRDAPLVRVLLITATGRLRADIQRLASAFPRARFEVYAATAAEAEVAEMSADRILTRTVAGGALAWVLQGLRISVSHPAPTLVHASPRRARQVRLLSSLWLRSDALVITSMDHVAGALRMSAGER